VALTRCYSAKYEGDLTTICYAVNLSRLAVEYASGVRWNPVEYALPTTFALGFVIPSGYITIVFSVAIDAVLVGPTGDMRAAGHLKKRHIEVFAYL